MVCVLAGGCFEPEGSGPSSDTEAGTTGTAGPSSSDPSSSATAPTSSGATEVTTDPATTDAGETTEDDDASTSGSEGSTSSGTAVCDDVEGPQCDAGQYCVEGACIDPPDGMVAVPAGAFWMGCNEEIDSECAADEFPYHEVFLDAYAIDRYEVTVANYEECVDAGECSPRPAMDAGGNVCESEPSDLPVGCTSWFDARDYCMWRGARLPTEAEWEKAARGADGRRYPWGEEEPDCTLAVMSACPTSELQPVGSKPGGASPFGALDVAGNAWEWTADWYGSAYYVESPASNPPGPDDGSRRVLRGGGPNYLGPAMRASFRRNDFEAPTPSTVAAYITLRCAVSP